MNHKDISKLYIISYLWTILSSTNCLILHGRDDIYGRMVLGERDRKREYHCWSQELQYNYYSTCGASIKMPGCSRPGTSFLYWCLPAAPLHYEWTLLAFPHGSFSCFPPLLLPLLSFLHISFRELNNMDKRDFHLPCQHCHTHTYSNVLPYLQMYMYWYSYVLLYNIYQKVFIILHFLSY